MKWYLFSIGLVFFIIYRSTRSEVNIQGTWKGVYSMNQKKVDVKIVFGENNNLEMYSSDMNSSRKATGSYTISSNNKIAINCKWPDDSRIAFSMNGRLSQKKDFVDGGWVAGDNLSGGFYLAKSSLR